MNNSFNERILNRIFDSISRFRSNQISPDNMVSEIWSNLTVLEGLDYESLEGFLGTMGEIETIKWIEGPEKAHNFAIQKINSFENNLR